MPSLPTRALHHHCFLNSHVRFPSHVLPRSWLGMSPLFPLVTWMLLLSPYTFTLRIQLNCGAFTSFLLSSLLPSRNVAYFSICLSFVIFPKVLSFSSTQYWLAVDFIARYDMEILAAALHIPYCIFCSPCHVVREQGLAASLQWELHAVIPKAKDFKSPNIWQKRVFSVVERGEKGQVQVPQPHCLGSQLSFPSSPGMALGLVCRIQSESSTSWNSLCKLVRNSVSDFSMSTHPEHTHTRCGLISPKFKKISAQMHGWVGRYTGMNTAVDV